MVNEGAHFKPAEAGKEILRTITRGRDAEEKLFPGWSQAVARKLIKDAARKHRWSTEYVWDGVHTLRHGGAAEAQMQNDPNIEMLKKGGWSSKRSVRWYAKRQRGHWEG